MVRQFMVEAEAEALAKAQSLEKNRKIETTKIEMLSKILEEAGIALDDEKIIVNPEGIINQVKERLEIANRYEDLLEAYLLLNEQLEDCKDQCIVTDNEEL